MSSHSSEIRMAATENSTAETNGGAKKANGKNYENSASETDLGSVASSVNTSADEEEEEEDISSDHEVQFKSKKSRRTPASSSARSTRASRRNSSPVTSSPAPARTLSPAPIEKRRGRGRPRKFDATLNSAPPASNSPTPSAAAATPTAASKRPRLISSNSNNSQKSSSNITNCLLCSEVTEDLGRHLALTHFKAKLLKVLPVQPPFKCPKCSLAFSNKDGGQDGLIVHYGSYHNLNDKYLEDDLKLKPTNNGHKQQPPRRSRRTTTTTTSAISNATGGEPNSPSSSGMCPPSPDSRVECKLCGTKVSNLNDHAFEEHFKEDVLASLPRSSPFYCPRCSNRYDTLEGLVKHFVKDHEILETYLAKGLAKTDNDLNSSSSSNR